jgi:hypothetical protein
MANRPVSERVTRRLASLSAKYIALFALLVAVPVICTSAYLLDSSYQDNKRALARLQQEKAQSVAVTIDQYFTDLTKRMAAISGRYLSREASSTIGRSSRRGRRGSTSVPCTRHGPCPTQDHDR